MSVLWEARNKFSLSGKDLIFQSLDWYCEDIITEIYPVFKIFVFGVDQDHSPVSVCINDFCPFFFIEVPSNWDSSCIYSVKESINNKSIKSFEFLRRKKYFGFENNKMRSFLKLSFYSSKCMRNVKYQIEKNVYQVSGKEYRFELYESNIDPILRFTHIRDILTTGWIKITNYQIDESDNYTCSYKSINAYTNAESDCKISDIRVLGKREVM